MSEKTNIHKLNNGMTIIGVPVAGVQSAAFEFLLPGGASLMPDGCCGAPAVIEDWIFRGAGGKSSREITDLLDGLGLHRGSAVESKHIALAARPRSGKSAQSHRALRRYHPQTCSRTSAVRIFKTTRLQGLLSLEDDPRHKTMLLLGSIFIPTRWAETPQANRKICRILQLKKQNRYSMKISVFHRQF